MTQSIEIARYKDTVYARVSGLGNFNTAGPFRGYVEAQIESGARALVLDLGPCSGLDSTFMGTLAGFMTVQLPGEDAPRGLDNPAIAITVVNQNPTCARAMQSLGLQAILTIRDKPVKVPPVKLEKLEAGWLNETRRIKLIRDAHEKLVAFDKGNAAKFGPFLEALRRESENKRGE
ncbi:MAG: STAS domain-containing protein [Planctomycetes bacterium]|nr:STAS domain-containing protein [Planctomycetota bacterium]NUQ35644.1 STAS domain-containing protein [Planctomycetaceae bacterium]